MSQLATVALAGALALLAAPLGAAPPMTPTPPAVDTPAPEADPLPSVEEARGRAKLLHETMHATLQIVHHAYYREDEGLDIPAATLKDVFRELTPHKVHLRWLVVDAQAMNVDHNPQDDFEKEAVQALRKDKEAHEQAANGVYRRAAKITLTADCLKCHQPNRTSTKDRAAGLVITMPIRTP